MDNLPDNYPCPNCHRYTCRCGEAPMSQSTSLRTTELPEWAPWMAARAANA